MVVCKFFMSGYCRFGANCRFEHFDPHTDYEQSADDRTLGTSILKGGNTSSGTRQEYEHSVYQTPQQQQQQQQQYTYQHKSPKFNVHEIMQFVQRDIDQAEKGNQWQLSIYCPRTDMPNFPGLEDHSFEELRWECYKACQTGTLPLWQAVVQQLFANVAKINNELKKKDTAYALIDRYLRDVENNTQSNTTLPFGENQPSSPVTGSTISGVSVFGGNNANSSFGSINVNTSVFGGSSISLAPSFGGSSITSAPSFGGSSINSAPSFGGNNMTPAGFGSTNSFAQPTFASNNGASASLNNPFFSQVTSQTPSNNSFSFSLPQQQAVNVQTHPVSGSMFGGNQTLPTSSPNSQQLPLGPSLTVDILEYSKEEELSAEELEALKSSRFIFGKIPTKPPPKSLCNV